MLLADLAYDLPAELIAQRPLPERDAARLLVVDRATQALSHHVVRDLPDLLRPGDLVVLNDTRVVPGRLQGRTAAGRPIELLLLLDDLRAEVQECLVRGARAVKPGTKFTVDDLVAGEVLTVGARGRGTVRLDARGDLLDALEAVGLPPLPPYIRRPRRRPDAEDRARYQTVYAREPGAIAAPTAGLHFTKALLHLLTARGIAVATVTLHVGYGTFAPLTRPRLEENRLAPERYRVPGSTVAAVAGARARGGRVVAVGSTTVRSLESAAHDGTVVPSEGRTDLLVVPGHCFRVVDLLLTNFHLPGTSLLALVMAFAGIDLTRRAYAEAIARRYRFYSYGDGMLVR